MTASLIISSLTTWAGLTPVPELGLALQLASLGAALGSAVALRANHRSPTVDTWRMTTAWATLGLAVGIISVVV